MTARLPPLARTSTAFQALGRSLMLPIAVLPVAGLLLRLGQGDIAGPIASALPFLQLACLATAANAIFDNLGLLFAVGVAVGFARESHGAAALAALIGYLVATEGTTALVAVPAGTGAGLPADLAALVAAQFQHKAIHDLAVPIGIITGVVAGAAYNRYHAIRLPKYLAFFGGRRFVPIVMGLFGVLFALVLGASYAALLQGITALSQGVAQGGSWGLFLYGALNRLLIVTGLHHILNNVVWFILGDYHGASGDLRRFFAGDPSAGVFMAGFFPVMMFGLPAACLAMYHAARPERRKEVGGMLLSQALTSFLTGVTEPIEFTFMFLAPTLYLLHMVLTGLAFVILKALDVRLGFSFSAGLFDYLINFSLATNPLRLIPVGLGFGVIYYTAFAWTIARFDLKTPGREPASADNAPIALDADADEGAAWLAALGGPGNLATLGACTTRLRLTLHSDGPVDEAALRRLGAKGLVRPAAGALQVIIGPDADRIAAEIARVRGTIAVPPAAIATTDEKPLDAALVKALAKALGGEGNVVLRSASPTRLVLSLRDATLIDTPAMKACGILAWSDLTGDPLHLIRTHPGNKQV